MNIHVIIGTTRGPVAIQRITREQPGVQSVICLDGTVEALPVSQAYHDFVRRGTGLIARDFGHDAFRVDLDRRIDQGVSWQLPLYVAHALEAGSRLGNGSPSAGDTVIWATGAVSADGQVRPVARTADKLEQSLEQIVAWREQGIDVRPLLPQPNLAEGTRSIANLGGVAGVLTLADALQGLGKNPATENKRRGTAPGRVRWWRALPVATPLLVTAGILLLAVALWALLAAPPGKTPANKVIILDDFGGQVKRPESERTPAEPRRP